MLKNRRLRFSSARAIIRTLKTTRNFWTASTLMYSKGRKKILFRNGSIFNLNLVEYVSIRDIISAGSKVEQVGGNLFRIKTSKYELVVSGETMGQLRVIVGTKSDMYNCDCLNKVVLDVGGLEGETAVLFSGMGAKKVIIYEPVVAHEVLIKRNVLLNRIEAELHEEGIGDSDGTQTIQYETTDGSFGTLSKGKYVMEIKIRNVTDVIAESHADIAKFNCEGAESSLVQIPCEILRKIDFYMVEVHSHKIRKAIMHKFEKAGFRPLKEIHILGEISVIHFKKNPV